MILAKQYGKAPISLGHFDLECNEMMCWLYYPVKFPKSDYRYVENLKFVEPLLEAVHNDLSREDRQKNYIYLTAKRLYVTPQYIGNRPGWHSDGFGTNDLNYIWYDRDPTLICEQPFELSPDHHKSMEEMVEQVKEENITTYPCKNLLRLDQSVIHDTNVPKDEGMRTFIKISVSEHKYNMAGNSHNYLFDYDWKMCNRDHTRNFMSSDES